MLFTTPPQTAGDIRSFCARFNEGLRVEYKGSFDANVRRNLPKVVSSFANSLGGVLIVSVDADDGVPRLPIEGFLTPREELPLTIENICLQNINPPVLPRITQVAGDVGGRMFLVIEVDESWEAPHAIENSKRVYVRTGNAANPYDDANVDLIIELVRRRAEPGARREHLLARARRRANAIVPDEAAHVQIGIAPLYPRRPLSSHQAVWDFLTRVRYQGAHYFPAASFRRVEDGVASFNRTEEYSQISAYGFLFTKRLMQSHAEAQVGVPVIAVREVFHPLFKLLKCANAFYSQVGYRGNIEVSALLNNVRLQRMQFLPDPYRFHDADDYQCYEESVNVSEISSAELLQDGVTRIAQDVLAQVCWSFWQAAEQFPDAPFRDYIADTVRRMGF